MSLFVKALHYGWLYSSIRSLRGVVIGKKRKDCAHFLALLHVPAKRPAADRWIPHIYHPLVICPDAFRRKYVYVVLAQRFSDGILSLGNKDKFSFSENFKFYLIIDLNKIYTLWGCAVERPWPADPAVAVQSFLRVCNPPTSPKVLVQEQTILILLNKHSNSHYMFVGNNLSNLEKDLLYYQMCFF